MTSTIVGLGFSSVTFYPNRIPMDGKHLTPATKPVGGQMFIVPFQKWDSLSLFPAVYK